MGSTVQDLDVVVVGAGFGGCYLLHLLRKNGFKTRVLEAGTTLGGVWCWNVSLSLPMAVLSRADQVPKRYPGARVDCEMPYYGYSDPDIWSTWIWTERYPSDSELRAYFRHVDDIWDLSKDVELRTRVVDAHFRDSGWDVKTEGGGQYRCKWFIAATGTSAR